MSIRRHFATAFEPFTVDKPSGFSNSSENNVGVLKNFCFNETISLTSPSSSYSTIIVYLWPDVDLWDVKVVYANTTANDITVDTFSCANDTTIRDLTIDLRTVGAGLRLTPRVEVRTSDSTFSVVEYRAAYIPWESIQDWVSTDTTAAYDSWVNAIFQRSKRSFPNADGIEISLNVFQDELQTTFVEEDTNIYAAAGLDINIPCVCITFNDDIATGTIPVFLNTVSYLEGHYNDPTPIITQPIAEEPLFWNYFNIADSVFNDYSITPAYEISDWRRLLVAAATKHFRQIAMGSGFGTGLPITSLPRTQRRRLRRRRNKQYATKVNTQLNKVEHEIKDDYVSLRTRPKGKLNGKKHHKHDLDSKFARSLDKAEMGVLSMVAPQTAKTVQKLLGVK